MSDINAAPPKGGEATQSAAADFLVKLSTPIAKMAEALSGDLYQAIAYYEVFAPSGKDADLIKRVVSLEISLGFNVISESLQLGCILALCRLWDKSGDAVHIPAIATYLKRNRKLVGDQNDLNAWLADVEAVETSEALKALREFRNVGLAHRANPNRPDPRILRNARHVVHGDERNVLDATVGLIDRLNALVDYPYASLGDQRKEWVRHGTAFWERVAENVAKTAEAT